MRRHGSGVAVSKARSGSSPGSATGWSGCGCFAKRLDSSYGRSPKPIYGFVIFANGTPIAWASRKMKIVPLSSCEAEIYGCMEVCRCAMWIRLLLGEVLTTTPELPMVCHTDNEAAKATIEKLGVTARTKHYDTWMHYCRELITQLKITMHGSQRQT